MIQSILGFVETLLTYLHDLFFPIFGQNSWGWAIIALTLIVRVALLPLAIKQTRSMRAMQAIQPQMKALQKKYKVDKELLKKDPEQYKAKKSKLNEEMMALYKEEGANPAASCLPLLAQAPIFIALFYTLRQMTELGQEGFYFLLTATPPEFDVGLRTAVSAAGWPGWLLIVLMSGTMFLSQKQMMARSATTGSDNPMAQQQKILLYVMPVFLAVVSFQFPIGILLYWVTTNFWQVVQQAIILREVSHEVETGELANRPGGEAAKKNRLFKRKDIPEEPEGPAQAPRAPSPGASSGKKPVRKPEEPSANGSSPGSGTNGAVPDSEPSPEPEPDLNPEPDPAPPEDEDLPKATGPAKRDHLPRRRGGSKN